MVKVGDRMLAEDLAVRAVGWLERPGFPTGSVPKECVDVLVAALRGGIFRDGYRGIHTCNLCGKALPEVRWRRRKVTLNGHGHYLLQSGLVVPKSPILKPQEVLSRPEALGFVEARQRGSQFWPRSGR